MNAAPVSSRLWKLRSGFNFRVYAEMKNRYFLRLYVEKISCLETLSLNNIPDLGQNAACLLFALCEYGVGAYTFAAYSPASFAPRASANAQAT